MYIIFQQRFSEDQFEEACEALESGEVVQVSLGTDPYSLPISKMYYDEALKKYGDSLLYRQDSASPFQYQMRLAVAI